MTASNTESLRAAAATYWTPKRLKDQFGGKKLLLAPIDAAELLHAIGLMAQDGSFSRDNMRKFTQINHMIQCLKPALDDLVKRHTKISIVDLACGSSFLTLAMSWYLTHVMQHEIDVLGIDRRGDLIEKSTKIAQKCNIASFVRFAKGDLQDIDLEQYGMTRIHLTTALHGCDIATDYALAIGLRHKSDHIAVAPCCQAELNRNLQKNLPEGYDGALAPVFAIPQISREICADLTDAMRVLLTRSKGYAVTASEFVPSEHTPKNRLLLATRRGNFHTQSYDKYETLKKSLGDQGIFLEALLQNAT